MSELTQQDKDKVYEHLTEAGIGFQKLAHLCRKRPGVWMAYWRTPSDKALQRFADRNPNLEVVLATQPMSAPFEGQTRRVAMARTRGAVAPALDMTELYCDVQSHIAEQLMLVQNDVVITDVPVSDV